MPQKQNRLDEILEAVEGHGKYHTSAYDGPVMTVPEARQAIIQWAKECVPHTYPRNRFPNKDLSDAAAIGAMEMRSETLKNIEEG